jgi:NitT/TauT family transport system ATP-binding protein
LTEWSAIASSAVVGRNIMAGSDSLMRMQPHSPAQCDERPTAGGASPNRLIEIAGLQKQYLTRSGDTVLALSNISLSVDEGEFLSIVGPSGCGKTTLLRILAALEPRTSGTVMIAGDPIGRIRNDVSVVFQQAVLLPWYDVLENILLPARLRKDEVAAATERAHYLLELVGLADFARKYPFELSGGMQQRISICRALLRDPRILLMDEPFGALDAMTRETMNLELMRIWAEQRKTVVFITHSIPEAVLLGDRVVVMSPRPGRISQAFDIDIERPRNLATMSLPRFGRICGEVRALFGGDAQSASHL